MIPNILRTAEPLKCKVIDYFMAKNDNIIIGNEVMYGIKRKVVDLLLIKENSICAIEIKGDNDNLNRLPEQLVEYSKIFDYVYVFSTPKHVESLIDKLPLGIGIFIINEEKINEIRRPQKQKKHDKIEMLYSMSCQYLLSKGIKSGKDSDDLRKSISKKNMTWIHSLLLDFYTDKLKTNYTAFKNERGIVSHVDDIPLLNGGLTISP